MSPSRDRPAAPSWCLDRRPVTLRPQRNAREQPVDAGDLAVGDPTQHVGKPSRRIDPVELGAFDQGVGDRGRLAAARGAEEEEILPSGGHALQSPFSTIVVRFRRAMVGKGRFGPTFRPMT